MLGVVRIAALVVVLLAVAPAVSAAGWSTPERGRGGEPRPEVEVIGGPGRAPLKVRTGRRTVRLPGSEGGGEAVAAAGPRGLLAAAWSQTECEDSDEAGTKGFCTGTVLATSWRRGKTPPRPAVLSRADGTFPETPALAIGADGTVAVAWDVLDDDYVGVPVRVDAAVARGTGSFAVQELVSGDTQNAGVLRVRGVAQIAVAWEAGEGTRVGLADARRGRLGPLRTDAKIDGSHATDLTLLRSARGDRLLAWPDDAGELITVRHGAPGRRLATARSFAGAEFSAVLSERGDFGVLTARDAGRNVIRQFVVRGRTGRRALRRQALAPRSYTGYGAFSGQLAIDRGGRAYVVWDRGVRGAISTVVGASASRGEPFGRGVRLSSPRRPAFCAVESLTAREAGAVARWRCNRAGPGGRFFERSVYRLDG